MYDHIHMATAAADGVGGARARRRGAAREHSRVDAPPLAARPARGGGPARRVAFGGGTLRACEYIVRLKEGGGGGG